MTVPHCEVDARVGGKYRVEMHAPTGAVHIVTGEFKEIKPPERLVFSWGWLNRAERNPETLVTVTFKPKDGGTDLTLEQSGFLKDEFREGHREGWTSSFSGLDALLAGRPKAPKAGPVVMGDARSTYTRAARIAFFEKGVAHALQPTPPQTPDVLAQNPFGKIPVLKLGEASLYESSAILHYIDEAYPGPALMPQDRLARAEPSSGSAHSTAMPMRRSCATTSCNMSCRAAPTANRTGRRSRPRSRKSARCSACSTRPTAANDYLVDNKVSLPDILLAPAVNYLGVFPEGKELLSHYSNVRRAREAFAARPSFISATQAAA